MNKDPPNAKPDPRGRVFGINTPSYAVLVLLVAQHQNSANHANKNQGAHFDAGADRCAVIHIFEIGYCHWNTPCQRNQKERQSHNNGTQNHKNLRRSG